MKWLSALVLAGIAAAVATHGAWWSVPDRHNPWTPLAYEEPPNWLTGHKLSRLQESPAACTAWMASTPWQFEAVPDRVTGPGCGLSNALLVRRTALQVGQAFTLSCPAAASLALWERHVLQPQALEVLGTEVRRIDHFGSYACRNVYGREAGSRSQHATADAFDIAGFVLRDGRRVTVARGWAGGGAEAEFLRRVHGGACGLFDGVLGPAYNQAHADHFHLDRGPYRICR